MIYKQKKKTGKKEEKTNLSIFELESKHDNLECEDEKLIWKQFIKQKLCPLKHGCLRDCVTRFTDLAQSFLWELDLPIEKLKTDTICEL